jgi:hypothetical protein
VKFVALQCRCSLDLTAAEPVNVVSPAEGAKYGECPDCHRTYPVEELEEPTAQPEPEPVAEPSPEPEPAAEPAPEPDP